ncbi:hypothetical protein ACFSQ7_35185 [Paenibacillus rhizoplanae]
MTYKLFPDTAHKTINYDFFGATGREVLCIMLFISNPMNMVQIYTLMNALAISLFAVFSLCISMLLNLKKIGIFTLFLPVIILYIINYIFDSFPELFVYDIRIILQPAAVGALTDIITWEKCNNRFFVGWMLVNFYISWCSFL